MTRRIVAVAVAVLLAGAGTFVLVAYVKGAENRALAGEELTDVLVVRENIAKGTPAEELGDRVGTEQVPRKVAATGGVADVATLDGRVAAVALVPGEQVVSGRFVTPQVLQAEEAVEVPEGMQEVTVSLSPERTVGGRIQPGDVVGVFASFTDGQEDAAEDEEGGGSSGSGATSHLILHKVLVTNVQGESLPTPSAPSDDEGDEAPDPGPTRDPAPGNSLLVTVAVDASAAERVVFAAEHGSLWLSAQSEDTSESGTQIRTKETIYR